MKDILYEMLSGTPPFSEDRRVDMELRDQVLTANYEFYPGLFDDISEQAKDLIQKLLEVDPEERISSPQILQHCWLQDSEMMERARELVYNKGRKRFAETSTDSNVVVKKKKTDDSQ